MSSHSICHLAPTALGYAALVDHRQILDVSDLCGLHDPTQPEHPRAECVCRRCLIADVKGAHVGELRVYLARCPCQIHRARRDPVLVVRFHIKCAVSQLTCARRRTEGAPIRHGLFPRPLDEAAPHLSEASPVP